MKRRGPMLRMLIVSLFADCLYAKVCCQEWHMGHP